MGSVERAWAGVPAPPAADLAMMAWGWGDEAASAFVRRAPMEVDRTSVGFEAATPLFELPPRASAAYLGTYLMSLLEGLVTQSRVGLFLDIVTRAHTLTMLDQDVYWSDVVEAHLDGEQREALREVLTLLVDLRDMLNLDDEQVARFRVRSAGR